MCERRHTSRAAIHNAAFRHAGRGGWPLAALVAMLCVTTGGCGGDRLYPVTITVRLTDGRPAANCSVILQRKEAPAIMGGGPVGSDGSCMPLIAGRTSPGLPPGTYRVAVTAETGPPVDGAGRKPLPFATRFTNLDESRLEVQVGPDRESAVTLVLEP